MSVVGIDLGTTNTVVAAVRGGKVHVLADEKGARLLPSVVSFHPNGDVLVGASAKARRIIDAKNTVYSHKRLIGRSWNSPEIVQAKQRFPFELREGPGQGPLVHARNQDFTLPEISAFVLKRARQISEAALGEPVERAVITVPAHFNELQRASTKVAGRVSGLEVLRILNEPTAAALAYGLGRSGSERVAVYDFGGGTFDCTLLDLNGNVFEVLATAGDSFLGGDDVDQLIADRMAESYLKQFRQDIRSDAQAYERLKTTAEEIKIALSSAETHTVVLKELSHGMGGSSVTFTFTMTRRDLEAAMTPIVDRTFKVTQDALSLARLSPSSFDKVILVGGSTRAPLVRKRVEAFFGSQPMDRVNPDEVVAIGAAIQAAALTEGQRRRSIPAPPGQRKPDAQDFTATSALDPNLLKPAFASEPPAFGFASNAGSQPPPANFGFPSQSARRTTAQGYAPLQTKERSQAFEDDQSLPDLQAPAPFEWVPPTEAGDDTAAGADPNAVTKQQAAATGGRSPYASHVPDYNRIDEPPSVFATSSGRQATAGRGSSPSLPDGPFGAVSDLSLISTTGVSSSEPANQPFGHVSDLSLISTSSTQTETGVTNELAAARAKALASGAMDIDPPTAVKDSPPATTKGAGPAVGPGRTVQLGPTENPAASDEQDSLLDRMDLPAVVAKAKPARKPGEPAVPMGAKPPPLMAPQPFGPMEKIGDDKLPSPATQRIPSGAKGPPPGIRKSEAKLPAAIPQRDSQPSPVTQAIPQKPPPPPPPPAAQAKPAARPAPPVPPQAPPPPPSPFVQTQPAYRQPSAPPPAPREPSIPPPPPRQPSFHPPPAQAYQPAPQPPPPPQNFGGFGAYSPTQPQPPAAFGGFGATSPSSRPPPPHHPSQQPPALRSAPPPDASAPLDFANSNYAPSPHEMNVPPGGAPAVNSNYQSPVLVDVTPRGLVVETAGGYTDIIIPRNSKIPCERTRRFATGRDMQTSVRVRVAQGEGTSFGENTYLGEVELSGLRPAPRGEVTVAVTFEVDADGILKIRARDTQTGQEARATLQLIGVADESSVVMMINKFARQPVVGQTS